MNRIIALWPDHATLIVLGFAFVFGLAGASLGIPAGWLSGAMSGGIIALTLFKLKASVPKDLLTLDFIILGLIMGSSVTPETARLMGVWPLPAFGLVLCVASIIWLITLYLIHVEKWPKTTAFLSSVPGGLSTLLAFAFDMKADVRTIAFVQTVRLAFLVIVLPLPFTAVSAGLTPPALPALSWQKTAFDFALLALSAGLAMAVAKRIKLPGGPIVACMIASGLLYGSNSVEAHLPSWLFAACMVVLGAMMAERFFGMTAAELKRLSRAGVGVLMLGLVVSVSFAFVFARLSGLPFISMLLAYAPGGVEAMAILAYALQLDPAFVAAMHLLRFLLIALGLPLTVRLVIGRSHV